MKRTTIAALAILGLVGGLAACGGGNVDKDPGGGIDVPADGTPGDMLDNDGVQPPDGGGRDPGGEDPGDDDPGFQDPGNVEDPGDFDPGEDPGVDPDVDLDAPDCEGPWCEECEPDERLCIDVYRDEQTGECITEIREGFCLIDEECYFQLQPNPDYPCLFCVPLVDQTGFSASPGMPCDDGEPCTIGDVCGETGVCEAGTPNPCDDEQFCTIDRCTMGVGCTHTPRTGAECDDASVCTRNDTCSDQGVCTGIAITCRDTYQLWDGTTEPNPCTDDTCDPVLGCVFVPNDNACSDGNVCTVDDTCIDGACVGVRDSCNDDDPCTDDYCIDGPGGGCRNQTFYGPCDDGDACTRNDSCTGTPPQCIGQVRVCNDNNPCTSDSCDSAVGCVFAPIHGGACTPVGGSDACTVNFECIEGQCMGEPKVCDDGEGCTNDWCDPTFGCRFVPTTTDCDDKNACTVGENCATGTCTNGTPVECRDGNPCTFDSCDPAVGCVFTNMLGPCDDGDSCSIPGTGYCEAGQCITQKRSCDDGDPCTDDTCDVSGACLHTVHNRSCEDGNLCTVGEMCVDGFCVGGTTRNCNDDNACTVDECNPTYGCVYAPSTELECDDHDKCTAADSCQGMECVGTPRVCEDYNLCTDNTCDPAIGCVFVPNDLLCDDDNVCTVDDQCSGGECLGISLFEDPSNKAAQLSFGAQGKLSQGVNVDDDEATCAPKGCDPGTGVDNSLGTLSWLFNGEFIKAVTAGRHALLFEHEDLRTDGSPYQMNVFWGERIDPVACDPATPGCNYGVYPSDLISPCDPKWIFDNAKIKGTTLTAGGFEYQMPLSLIFGEARIPLMLRWVRIRASVSLSGGVIVSGSGALGGWVPRQDIIDGVEAIPMIDFPAPYTRDIVLAFLNLYLNADIDSDGDGVKDGVSLGMPFTLTTGHIIGPL
jgi:hypothetical protein